MASKFISSKDLQSIYTDVNFSLDAIELYTRFSLKSF